MTGNGRRALLRVAHVDGSPDTGADRVLTEVNFIKAGAGGAVRGTNALVVYDVAGNARTVAFTLK